jgi:primary-amine oxidase
MQDAVAEIRAVAEPTHPLDPLTPDEIRRAAAAVRAAHDLGPGMMFETISLHEPDKRAVQGARPGQRFLREAFVCAFDRTNGKVWEARVDLVAGKVVDWRHVPGARPRILIDDILLVGEVARADPRFQAALARRGITDIDNVQVDPWSAGNYGLPDEAGRRLSTTATRIRLRDSARSSISTGRRFCASTITARPMSRCRTAIMRLAIAPSSGTM